MMKKIVYSILFVLVFNTSFAQNASTGSYNEIITYKLELVYGDENILKTANTMQIEYNYDSAGINYGCNSEDLFLRFKMLHFYMDGKPGRGEEFKEDYDSGKKTVTNKFHSKLNDYCDDYCKDLNLHFDPAISNTKYIMRFYFIDIAQDPQLTDWAARVELIEAKTGKSVLEYYIYNARLDAARYPPYLRGSAESDKKYREDRKKDKNDPSVFYYKLDRYNANDRKSFYEISFTLGKHFKEIFKK